MQRAASTIARRLKTAFGWMLVVFGVLMIAGGALQLGDSELSLVGNLVMIALVGVLPAFGGWRMIQNASDTTRLAAAARSEKLVLAVARANGWAITPVDVAASSTLTMAEAQATLDAMAKSGHAELTFQGDQLIYRFPRAAVSDPYAALAAQAPTAAHQPHSVHAEAQVHQEHVQHEYE